MSQDKKELLYGAALSLIHENRDLSNIKVADIAAKANMGKSTVYEYFDSKEQLIAEAMINMFKGGIAAFEAIVDRELPFKETYMILLKNLSLMLDKKMSMMEYMTINESNFALHKTIKNLMNDKLEEIRISYLKAMEKLVDKSLVEGIVKKKPSTFEWYMAIINSMTYVIIHKQGFPEFSNLSEEEVRERAYKAFVKSMNSY